jgi:DNA-binding transcriptional ArsR family regulator
MDQAVKRRFKDALFEEFARIGKAIGSSRRLELIELLAQGERTVDELANETSQPIANTSQHLQVLRQAQLVETRRCPALDCAAGRW